MADSASNPDEKAREFAENRVGDSTKEAVLLETSDGPCVPAPPQQFQITNLQQWIDLCA
jgi:hypothetical protein